MLSLAFQSIRQMNLYEIKIIFKIEVVMPGLGREWYLTYESTKKLAKIASAVQSNQLTLISNQCYGTGEDCKETFSCDFVTFEFLKGVRAEFCRYCFEEKD